jgi:hypothetical protein
MDSPHLRSRGDRLAKAKSEAIKWKSSALKQSDAPNHGRSQWVFQQEKHTYDTLWETNIAIENHNFFMGKSTINGHFQ